MTCRLAENLPLMRLARRIEVAPHCHSSRTSCIRQRPRHSGELILASSGAAIGYCQALFNRMGEPGEHTEQCVTLLRDIGAPWSESHELFWGFRHSNVTADAFIEAGSRPLRGKGRVPVIITSLDPAYDTSALREIFAASPQVFEGETILVRLILSGPLSVDAAAMLLMDLLSTCLREKQMPRLWPLFQGLMSRSDWQRFRRLVGEYWSFVNIAVNPFMDAAALEEIAEQVTVAQAVVGEEDGIGEDGMVKLGRVKVLGAETGAYSLPLFFGQLRRFGINPTIIVLGPALPEWSVKINQERLRRFIPVLRSACDVLWQRISSTARNEVWAMES